MAIHLQAAGALFDMDGTLVDSSAVVESAWATFAADHGLDLAQLLAFAHGRPTIATAAHYLPAELAATEAARIDALELVDLAGIRAIPGADRLLTSLLGSADTAARVGVVTSASRELASRRMRAAGVPIPEVMVCSGEVANGKPAPDGYLRAAELLGIPIESCAIFEDAQAGLESALSAGGKVVVVGPHESPTTMGLPRIPDFLGVTAWGAAGVITFDGVAMQAG